MSRQDHGRPRTSKVAAAPRNSPSGDRKALLPWIQGSLPTLKKAQRRIAEEVIRDPEEFISQPIAELARRCRVSAGSVVIFCKHFGLKGFPALKVALARELSAALFTSRDNSGTTDHFQRVFDEQLRALQETVRLNSQETFKAAAKLINRARRIVLFSIGLSYPIAYSIYAKMRFIGLPAMIEYDSHLQLAAASEMCRGEVGIGVSLAGNTRETVESLRLAKARGARTICITNSIGSLIAQTADIRFYAAPSEVKYFQAPLASRVTQVALVDALLDELSRGAKRRAISHLRRAGEHLLRRRLEDSKPRRRSPSPRSSES
jgi:RpiR family carbohydrate utilization transcriptional regulator